MLNAIDSGSDRRHLWSPFGDRSAITRVMCRRSEFRPFQLWSHLQLTYRHSQWLLDSSLDVPLCGQCRCESQDCVRLGPACPSGTSSWCAFLSHSNDDEHGSCLPFLHDKWAFCGLNAGVYKSRDARMTLQLYHMRALVKNTYSKITEETFIMDGFVSLFQRMLIVHLGSQKMFLGIHVWSFTAGLCWPWRKHILVPRLHTGQRLRPVWTTETRWTSLQYTDPLCLLCEEWNFIYSIYIYIHTDTKRKF